MTHNTLKVLIADDSAIVRNVIRSSLKHFNITDCDDAVDGQEAWNAMSKTQYSVIFIDYNMPKLNGLELAKKIFEHKKQFADTRIVIVSSSFNKDIIIKFKSFGVGTFITKPFGIDMFRMALEPILRREPDIVNNVKIMPLSEIKTLFELNNEIKTTYNGRFILLDFGEKTLAIDAQKIKGASKIHSLHNSSFEPINTAKALIADDSAMIRKLIKTSLEEFNIPNCDEAANGAEAWTMLNSSKSYDIFIMDYNMPQLNGLELALNIHNNKEKFANTKIIAISSSFNKETIAQFKNFGVGTFIKKPFRTAILKAAIGPILAYGLNKNTSPSLFGLDMLFKSTFTNATCDYNYVVLNFAEESLMIEINAILTASYIYANS